MGANFDQFMSLALFVWLAVLLTFMAAAGALFFSSRSLHLSITSAWRRPVETSRQSLRPLLVAIAMAIAAALLLIVSSGASAGPRFVLVVLAAGALGITLEWTWKASHAWTERQARQHREWSARATEAAAELERVFDPAQIAAATCRLLRAKLGYAHATLYLLDGEHFTLAASTAAAPLTPTLELGPDSLLRAKLTEFPTFHSVTVLDPLSGRQRAWAPGPAECLVAEQAVLAGVHAHYVLPLQREYALGGIFVLGLAEAGPALLPHAETIAAQCARSLANAAHAKAFYEQVAESMREQASRRTARASREHMAQPDRVNLPGLAYAVASWSGDSPGGAFHDILRLNDRAAAFFLAEIGGPIEESAVRLVQLQALVRSRASAYGEDFAELLDSTLRAIALSAANRPPVKLFCLRYASGTSHLRYANAGHFAPLLLHSNSSGAELLRLTEGCPALGEPAAGPTGEGEVALSVGDLLVLVSAGVTEASNAQAKRWGESGLIETVLNLEGEPPAEIAAGILDAAARHTAGNREAPPRIVIVLRAVGPVVEPGDVEPAEEETRSQDSSATLLHRAQTLKVGAGPAGLQLQHGAQDSAAKGHSRRVERDRDTTPVRMAVEAVGTSATLK